jgi:hypothetical protein
MNTTFLRTISTLQRLQISIVMWLLRKNIVYDSNKTQAGLMGLVIHKEENAPV